MKIVLTDLQNELIEAWQQVGQGKDYVTTYHGSIFDVDCDAVVSPANSFGFMDGGIDIAISQHFGWQIQQRLQTRIRDKHNGELLVGQAEIVETDDGRIPYIISAPTMRVPMILKETVNIYLAIRAALLLVKNGQFEDGVAIREKVNTIAIPGMGTGVGRVSPKIFARQMKEALEAVIEENGQYPATWWEATQKHQSLYTESHEIRDLQYE